jgi:hypothetical protein
LLDNAQPKPRPRKLEKRARYLETRKLDREQRAICKARSGGRCEVITEWYPSFAGHDNRCIHRATENHHLLSGIGVRNKGRSILAAHRLMVCRFCHSELHGHVLVPIGTGRETADSVRYERKK